VTYAKMQNISATSRFIGRITVGSGDPEELTGTQATTLLDVFTSSLKGLAPASGGGSTNYLRADGTWAAPPGTTVPGGSTTQLQYNNAGAFDGASGITVVGSETGLKLTYVEGPGTVATNGFVRLAEPTTVVPIVSYVSYNGSANSLALSISGDGSTFTDVFVGDAGATGNFSTYMQAKGQVVFNLAGTNEYVFGTTTADFTNNAIVTTGVLYLGASSGPGRINIANNQWISWKHATSGDVLGISVLSDNAVRVGNTTNAAALYLQSAGGAGFEIAAGGAVSMAFGATTEYSFSATAANFYNNALLFGSSAAASGYIRCPSGNADIIVVNQTTDRVVMSFSTTGPTVFIGGTTCDTTILSEHILRGKLGASNDVFLFEDDGDAAITALNVADASAKPFLIRAAGSTASNNGGGQLRLSGGRRAGTGAYGGVALRLNQDDSTYHTMVEATHYNTNQRVVGICGTANPSTAGSGDLVVYLGNCATAPSLGSSTNGGGVDYSHSGARKWQSSSGLFTTTGPVGAHPGLLDKQVSDLFVLTDATTTTLISIPLSAYGSASESYLFVKVTVFACGPNGSGGRGQVEEIYTSLRIASGPTYTLDTSVDREWKHQTSSVNRVGDTATVDISSGNLRVRFSAIISGESVPGPCDAWCMVELYRLF
jgi:hypothetical protein